MSIPYANIKIGEVVPIAIRAEDIIISLERGTQISARNILRGTIQYLDIKSERTWVSILVEWHHLAVKITHEAREQLQLREYGLTVYCIIKASAINRLWD